MSHSVWERKQFWIPLLVLAASFFLYQEVLAGLAMNVWADENYSHALLVPVVIAFIIWKDRLLIGATRESPSFAVGILLIVAALVLLVIGTLGAEVFTQRISILVFAAGVIAYFFGRRILLNLWIPGLLVLLSIPLPQILLTKITIPLQLLASQIAEFGVRLLGLPVGRNGNVINIVPAGMAEVVSLEVVDACTGIRSMMTLAALALVFAYLATREERRSNETFGEFLMDPALWHAGVLMVLAVPAAIVTNAARVSAMTVLTYYFDPGVTEGLWHEISGFIVFAVAFVSVAFVSLKLARVLPDYRKFPTEATRISTRLRVLSGYRVSALVIFILASGFCVGFISQRPVESVERQDLSRFPIYLDGTVKIGDDIRFPETVERVLGASDYVMREYRTPARQKANLYIGYYGSQRTGKTYHSPQNCLPGSGWEMSDWSTVELQSAEGPIRANQLLVSRNGSRGVMVYWYYGRGRSNTSEYLDKAGTVVDSITKGRTDGAIIRLLVTFESDRDAAAIDAIQLASVVANRLDPFVPR